jgi:excisionase family DNA binding protein
MDYTPITKEMAAAILSVSTRTIENWVAEGTMPAPRPIGRRVYWHPHVFGMWLDDRLLGSQASVLLGDKPEPSKRRGRPRKSALPRVS